VRVIELGQRPQLVVAILQNNAAFIVGHVGERDGGLFSSLRGSRPERERERERASERLSSAASVVGGKC
jgi:hypothetical protein